MIVGDRIRHAMEECGLALQTPPPLSALACMCWLIVMAHCICNSSYCLSLVLSLFQLIGSPPTLYCIYIHMYVISTCMRDTVHGSTRNHAGDTGAVIV